MLLLSNYKRLVILKAQGFLPNLLSKPLVVLMEYGRIYPVEDVEMLEGYS